jgi:2'-5' RNA ligase
VKLFFACWPPRETAQALAGWAAEVRNTSGGKLTVVDNIHLTLAFLGDADPDRASAAAGQVHARRPAGEKEPHSVTLTPSRNACG